jgi:hypothetical protein
MTRASSSRSVVESQLPRLSKGPAICEASNACLASAGSCRALALCCDCLRLQRPAPPECYAPGSSCGLVCHRDESRGVPRYRDQLTRKLGYGCIARGKTRALSVYRLCRDRSERSRSKLFANPVDRRCAPQSSTPSMSLASRASHGGSLNGTSAGGLVQFSPGARVRSRSLGAVIALESHPEARLARSRASESDFCPGSGAT